MTAAPESTNIGIETRETKESYIKIERISMYDRYNGT